MDFVLRTALKDLRRLRRDPMGIALWVIIPIFIGVVVKLAFGGPGAGPPKAHILVVDNDGSIVSRGLVGALGQGGESAPIRAESVSAADGRRRIDAGSATALLVIPEGFGRAVLEEKPTTLRLVTNPAQQILPSLVEGGARLLPDVVFYAHRLFGGPLRSLGAMATAGGAQEADVGALAIEVYRATRSLSEIRKAPLFELQVAGETVAQAPRPSLGVVFLPSILFMSLFFVASGLSGDVWVEREMGTLRRALVSPRSARAFFGGKVLASVALFAAIATLGLATARWAFGLPLSNLAAGALWATATGVVFLLICIVVQLHATSERTAGFLVNLVLLPLLMLGGSFFPFEIMPEKMAAIGRLTPNGWALVQLVSILAGQLAPVAFAGRLLALVLVGTLLYLWALRRLAGRFAGGLMRRAAWFIAVHDLRHALRQRETLLWTFAMPILFFYFMGSVTGGFARPRGGAPETLAVRVGADAGFLADALIARLEEEGFKAVRPDDAVPPPARPRPFESYARRLEIPARFTALVQAGERPKLTFRQKAGGLSAVYGELRVRRVAYTLLADVLASRAGGAGRLEAAEIDRLHSAPRTLAVEVSSAGRRRDVPSGFAQAVPGMMVMFTMLVLLTGGAAVLVVERRLGLLRRLAAAPISRPAMVTGKWASKLSLALVQIAFALLAGRLLFGVSWGPNWPMVFVVLLVYAAFMASLSLLLGSLARTEGQAVAVGVLAANVCGALGGCWWPIEVAPPFMQKLAMAFPTGWAMDALHKLVSFGDPPLSVLPHVFVFAVATLAVGALAARVFRYD